LLPRVGSCEQRARRLLSCPRCETGALAGPIEEGPRAALTWWGGPRASEPSENTGWVRGEPSASCVNRHAVGRVGVDAELARCWRSDKRKLVQKCLRFLLDFATYR
jgi:hypothetical protein